MSKKFGTFAGVFTPSILTILGVIMYLRLGWVVGQAGLYAALGLILLAHVISISTGLSLSSIATDKKIKTGGIYYMLSRSLGLPMGGAIGITLFIGTAFSIALYIVGFVENFISIEVISSFLGMEGSINDTRIIGSVVIIILVILAYISTSIAIKTQFFILGAIALSILSVLIGIFTQADIPTILPSLKSAPESPNLIVIFAIFFPAVTGFTAGVAMSGDLKSPKKSIPLGSLSAIGVGLVIYVALAIIFALFVDRDLLVNDTNFLLKIAWFSPLVVAGIWGATLSSALGGILGAPRILQAMSLDRITPQFFGKGEGKNNEPRQALLFTFVLAELGILIGELDVIAIIVSMFYIAAYGFINLAYVLESWANSDFRPSLRIPKWVGIIGFIASMGVMFKIDTLAMGVSLLIVFGIYILLKRREIQGNMSNVWQSVWTSLARSSLHKISQNPLNEKNWEPNIILFSGGANARNQLLELGSSFVGDHGFLSNFELIEKKDENFLFSKKSQNITSEISEKYPGVFTRQQSVSNIFEGIEMIAQTYGFSGVEPNTVMMSWARHSLDPIRFTQSVNNLVDLDLNVLLIDYDQKHGFGKYKKIDIWWRGGGSNGNLALYFSKFLLNSEFWSGAQIRLLIVNEHTEISSSIIESAKNILENTRIHAEVILIENEIEQKSFYEIIEKESLDSDLIFLGFPELKKGKEQEFVVKTTKLCQNIGTVIMIKSSSIFKELHLGELINTDETIQSQTLVNASRSFKIKKPSLPRDKALAIPFEYFARQIQNHHAHFIQKKLNTFEDLYLSLIQQLHKNVDRSFENIGNRLETQTNAQSLKNVIVAQYSLMIRAQNQYLKEINETKIPQIAESFINDISAYINALDKSIKEAKPRIKISRTKNEIEACLTPDKETRKAKNRLKILWVLFSKFSYYVNYQSLLDTHFPHKALEGVYQSLIGMDQLNYKMGNAFLNNMQKISDVFETMIQSDDIDLLLSKENLQNKQTQIHSFIADLEKNMQNSISQIAYIANTKQISDLNTFSGQLSSLFPNAYENHSIDYFVHTKRLKKQLKAFPEIYGQNSNLIYNQNLLNNNLLQFNHQLRHYINLERYELQENIEKDNLRPIKNLHRALLHLLSNKQATSDNVQELFKTYKPNTEFSISQHLLDLNDSRNKKIRAAAEIFPEKLELFSESFSIESESKQAYAIPSLQAAVRRTIDYLVDKEISTNLREFLIAFGPEIQVVKNEFSKLFQELKLFEEQKLAKETELDWDAFVQITSDKLSALLITLESKEIELANFFESKELHIKKALGLPTFVSNLTSLRQYIRVHTQKRQFEKLNKHISNLNRFMENQLNKLWYNQSSGLILARKLSKAMLRKDTRVFDLLQFKDNVSITKPVLLQLPDYYKQIFLRKQFYLKDFWVGRNAEFTSALESYKHFKNGYNGGIIVLGERNSGKSFFLNQLLPKLNIQGDIFQISAPYTGSTSPADLLSSFQIATEKTGTFAEILNTIPAESVLLIDDMELWWEKSPTGMRAIDQLMKLIKDYSHLHLFLFACDINAFQLINHFRKIESNFISLIELSPLNAKDIKEAILKRHLSSGMKFQYRNTPESAFRSWNYAQFFSSYFNYSEGNIGVALHSWMSNIKKVENNTLIISKPKQLDQGVFDFLETEWMIFIMHFILHKRMNLKKLARIGRESESSVQNKVDILKRAGIINQMADGILELNPYMLPFLQKALIKRQLF